MNSTSGGATISRPRQTMIVMRMRGLTLSGRRTTTVTDRQSQIAGAAQAGTTSRVQNAHTVATSGIEDRQCGQSWVGVGSSGAGL
jgi:hypothetical protein